MMIISHRGNLDGPNELQENHPDYIKKALLETEVEVDVWCVNGKLVLGHDNPQYEINKDFLTDRMWCHAKNIDALEYMLENDIHCFWHQEDDCSLTSRGYIWTYRDNPLTSKSICVMPELFANEIVNVYNYAGVCSDFLVPVGWETYRTHRGL